MCCRLQHWYRNGGSHCRITDNCRREWMPWGLIYQIHTGESSFWNVSRSDTEKWYDREVILNAISLACGFFGNFALLLNFTKRVRYIVALPLTIISWYFAMSIVSVFSTDLSPNSDCIFSSLG